MDSILEYIINNYIWILFGSIVVLFAIIGYYAEKTNFGQGPQNEAQNDNVDITNKKLQDLYNNEKNNNSNLNVETKIVDNIDNVDITNKRSQDLHNNEKNNNSNLNVETKIVDNIDNVKENVKDLFYNELSQNSKLKSFENTEKSFEAFDKDFNELLPKKNIIDNELLEEIDELSLDKTQKIDIGTIPDLNDLELPKIKNLNTKEKDIWKF